MSILKILKYPNPILQKKCLPVEFSIKKTPSGEEVKEITPEIKELIFNMMETMERNQGVGLAAPQVGELKRIIVINYEDVPKAFLNPKILKKSRKKETLEEGCLSFPGLFLKVKRAKNVEIQAIDEKGREIKIKTEGLPAIVFQHEIDHLDGILFIDRVGFLQKLKLLRRKNVVN